MRNRSPTARVRMILLPQAIVYLVSCSPPGDRPGDSAPQPESDAPLDAPIVTEILRDIAGVEEKLLALAVAFDDEQYAWHPGEGVRSSAQVFMHVAALNYFLPMAAGHEPPASTGITKEDPYTTAPAYEASLANKQPILAGLRASFEHLRSAIGSTTASELDRNVEVFGESITLRGLWVGHAGHLHEHLGQVIAYARTNGVVPPWSQ